MLKPVRLYTFFALAFTLLGATITKAGSPLVISAGPPQTVCPGDSVILGGSPTASGGTAPYTYTWTPATGMNNPTDANPHVLVNATTKFYVRVQDAALGIANDSVLITVDNIASVTAGPNVNICPIFDSATLGSLSNPPADTYAWTPTTGLTCATCPNPVAKPTVTTTYTLTASDGTCSNTTTVTVTVLPPPVVSTVSPVTIDRGQSVVLNVTGLTSSFQWLPTATISNPTSQNPTASPLTTTTYTVFGRDSRGCIGIDSVTVDVLNDSSLVFYNTFTPNGDGINDTWFIGNIDLFPNNEVLIFNRYGKEVYRANGYLDQWDGTNQGANLPDATYYYIVYTGTGKTYKGSVTIIRQPH